jgi:hypothetical protein
MNGRRSRESDGVGAFIEGVLRLSPRVTRHECALTLEAAAARRPLP